MKKVLIANRGEIAVRVIRACRDMGLNTVAVYSQADAESLHVLFADEAICIGKAPSLHSYLKVPNILSACEITGADAIHPGYGFLSESASFASICQSCGLNFIGPSSESISLLGDKSKAKALAKSVKCPIIPGSNGVVANSQEALKEAEKIGYPLFIKAVSGGGGRGIRIVNSPAELPRLFSAASGEAESSFNNPALYLEKMIVHPRHVEVQILGDKHGNYVYVGERDCTIQRRRQKLIEEAPCPTISPQLRQQIGRAAVNIAKAAKYFSVGTVEFLLDQKKNFYFMEMNTRIQVEHPVTEELSGIDLVREQIYVALGQKLKFKQKDIQSKGHVIQFRINAEDLSQNFAPSPGLVEYYIVPGGPNVRVDTACYSGYKIPPYYDSLIAKLIVTGRDRQEAIAIGKRALSEFHIGGVQSTVPFHQQMLNNKDFQDLNYHIRYVDELLESNEQFFAQI